MLRLLARALGREQVVLKEDGIWSLIKGWHHVEGTRSVKGEECIVKSGSRPIKPAKNVPKSGTNRDCYILCIV